MLDYMKLKIGTTVINHRILEKYFRDSNSTFLCYTGEKKRHGRQNDLIKPK